jgi:hypothetical protein
MTKPWSRTQADRTSDDILALIAVAPDGRIVMPWSRQQGESRQAFAAFRTYLEAEGRRTRSIRATANVLGKSRQLLERWSAQWRWVERCGRYDFALDRLRTARYFAAALAEAEERARLDALGATEALAHLLTDEDFMLYAALALPLDDLVALVGPEGLGAATPELINSQGGKR